MCMGMAEGSPMYRTWILYVWKDGKLPNAGPKPADGDDGLLLPAAALLAIVDHDGLQLSL